MENRDLYLNGFLNKLFESFESNHIEYVILRNYEELPDHLRSGGDIDFLLSNESYNKILNVLSSIPDLDILISSRRVVVHETIVHYHSNNSNLFIKLDFHPFEDWHGAIYFNSSEILRAKREYKAFFVPSQFHQACTLFFASYLYGGFIKKKYLPYIKSIISNTNDINRISPMFGKSNVLALSDYFNGNYQEEQLLKRRRSMLFHLASYNIKHDGIGFLYRFFKNRIEEVLLRIRYNGLIISVDNPTNSREIVECLRSFFYDFLNEDRCILINQQTSFKECLLSWDQVARLKILIYDNYSSSLLRKAEIVISSKENCVKTIVEYLILRQAKL